MSTHKSAEKRDRQNKKHRLRNLAVKSALKTKMKAVHASITGKNKEAATKALRAAVSALDKAASKGIIHKKNASRRISRLTQKVNAL